MMAYIENAAYNVDNVAAGVKLAAGTRINVVASDVTHVTNTPDQPNKGDACIVGNVIGVMVNKTATADGDMVVIDTSGTYVMEVVGTDEDGNQAVAAGDAVFINLTTAVISKDPSGVLFGVALSAVAGGATTKCAVMLRSAAVSLIPAIQDVMLFQGLLTNAVDVVTGFTFGRAVKVISWHSTVTVLMSGVATITFEKAGSDLAETLVLGTTAAVGEQDSVVPTTDGEDIFAAGDLLDVESDGTPTSGEALLWARILNL